MFLGRTDLITNAAITIDGGTVELTGAGSFTNSTTAGSIDINANATLLLQNLTSTNTTPLGGRNFRIFGGTLEFDAMDGGATNLAIGGAGSAITYEQGVDTIQLTAVGDSSTTLTLTPTAAVTHTTGAVAVFQGSNLGSPVGNGVAAVVGATSTSGFAFRGQTGATGTANKSVMGWVFITDSSGNVNFATADAAAAATVTGTSILRTLSASEEVSSITANDNIDLSAMPTMTASVSVQLTEVG